MDSATCVPLTLCKVVLVVRIAKTACEFFFFSFGPTDRYRVRPACKEKIFVLAITSRGKDHCDNRRNDADEKVGIVIMSKA